MGRDPSPRRHPGPDARRRRSCRSPSCSACAASRPVVPGSLVAVIVGVVAVELFDLADKGVEIVGHDRQRPAVARAARRRRLHRLPQRRRRRPPGSCSSASPRASARPRRTPPGTTTRSTPTASCSASGAANLGAGLVQRDGRQRQPVEDRGQRLGRRPLPDVRARRRRAHRRHPAVPHRPVREPARGDAGRGRHRRRRRARRRRRPASASTASTRRRLGRIYGTAARPDFIAAVAAMFGVLVFDTLPGLVIGIVVSLLLLLYRASKPHVAELGRVAGGPTSSATVDRHPENAVDPGVAVLRVESGLFFANADAVRRAIKAPRRRARHRGRRARRRGDRRSSTSPRCGCSTSSPTTWRRPASSS